MISIKWKVYAVSELGQALKASREAREISLDELQEITKIQKRYLTAIESGDFRQLPGDFYTRAFIKSYAESVGLDAQAFFDEHANEIPKTKQEPIETMIPSRSAVHQPKKRPARRSAAQTSKFEAMLPKILLIVLILIVFVAIWMIMQHVSGKAPQSSSTANSGTSVAYKKNATQKKTSVSSGTTQKNSTKTTVKKKSAPAFVLKKDSSSGSTTHYTLSNANAFKMKITSKTGQPSWISATDTTTNKQYAFGTVNKSTSFSFDASPSKEISINVGNTLNTAIMINGKMFKFPTNNITQRIYITYKK